MARCEVCGSDYDKALMVTRRGEGPRTLDSFESEIHALVPACAHCGFRSIGHGLVESSALYRCAHCARHQGAMTVQDRA